jgi:cell division protein FtsZ
MIEFEMATAQKKSPIASIKVVGIGGAGGNTVNSIVEAGCADIETIVVNTDSQALELSKASIKVQIGVKSTKGLGTGADPLVGKRAAEEDLDQVMDAIGAADIVFLTAGMGGGTGSGALPVIAKALKERNILSITIVTKPFEFEGRRRSRVAHEIIEQLKTTVDTLIVIPNQKLLSIADEHLSMIDAFGMINQVLSQSVRAISDIITNPGHINVDYADVRTIMKDRGLAVMGTGRASGSDRAAMAALEAISSPLLENMSIEGAHAVLLNITGGRNLTLHELSQAASVVYQSAHKDANIILGSVIDDNLSDEVMVTIIATGFDQIEKEEEKEEVILPRMEIKEATKVASPVTNNGYEEFAPKIEKTIEKIVENHAEAFSQSNSLSDAAILDLTTEANGNDLDIPTFLREKAERESQL